MNFPPVGVCMGIWTAENPVPSNETRNDEELAELAGSTYAWENIYTVDFTTPVSSATMTGLDALSVPMISWRGADCLAILSGSFDAQLTALAQADMTLPVTPARRWLWGMNLSDTGNSLYNITPDNYKNAWIYIREHFTSIGAKTSFIWCPSLEQLPTADSYYPGDDQVDVIAVNMRDRKMYGAEFLNDQFTNWYNHMATYGKPIMIAELGIPAADQVAVFQGLQTALESGQYPLLRAIGIYDGVDSAGDWTLGVDGKAALAALLERPFFSARFV